MLYGTGNSSWTEIISRRAKQLQPSEALGKQTYSLQGLWMLIGKSDSRSSALMRQASDALSRAGSFIGRDMDGCSWVTTMLSVC